MISKADDDSNSTLALAAAAAADGVVTPNMMLSYTADARHRFQDALTSFDYLLVNELPRTWTEVSYKRCDLNRWLV
jgi:hypothetical protein